MAYLLTIRVAEMHHRVMSNPGVYHWIWQFPILTLGCSGFLRFTQAKFHFVGGSNSELERL